MVFNIHLICTALLFLLSVFYCITHLHSVHVSVLQAGITDVSLVPVSARSLYNCKTIYTQQEASDFGYTVNPRALSRFGIGFFHISAVLTRQTTQSCSLDHYSLTSEVRYFFMISYQRGGCKRYTNSSNTQYSSNVVFLAMSKVLMHDFVINLRFIPERLVIQFLLVFLTSPLSARDIEIPTV